MRRRIVILTWVALAILALALLLTAVACTSSRKPASAPAPTTATTTAAKAPAAVAPTPPPARPAAAEAPVSAALSPALPAAGEPTPAVTAPRVTTPAAATTETPPSASLPPPLPSAPAAPSTASATVPEPVVETAVQTAPAAAVASLPTAAPLPPGPASQTAAEAAAPALAATAPVVESPAPKTVVPALAAGAAVETAPTAAAPSPATAAAPTAAQGDQAVAASDAPFAQSVDVLAGLESYRYVTVFSFSGEVEGEPESGSVEIRGAVAGPDRQMVSWKDLESGEEFGIIRIGDEAWMQEGETWTLVPTMVAELVSQAVVVFAPSVSWPELAEGVGTTATYVGTETVNGVPARHYTSTYSDWMQSEDVDVDEASGDVWMAEAGYPVRYRFTAKGLDEEGYEGSALWTMELSDVNGPVTIEAPQVVEDSGE